MSTLTMIIEINFYQDGKYREPLYLNIEMHKDNPSDDEIAEMVRDEIACHLEYPDQ